MKNANGERRVSTVAAAIIGVAVGLALAFFGVTLVGYGAFAFGEGETLIGVLTIILGLVVLGFLVAVAGSQLRAMYRRRG